MNKNLLILSAVFLVVVLGGGAFFFFSKNYTTPNQPVSQEQTPTQTSSVTLTPTPSAEGNIVNEKTEVILSQSGFSPKEITIKKGTKVVWTNNSGKAAAINSAPHPVHTSYPPLNLGSFNDGQSLELSFPDPGTYKYHNHLNASQTGTITVE